MKRTPSGAFKARHHLGRWLIGITATCVPLVLACDPTGPSAASGSITIVKDAQPNDAQDFTFTSNQANLLPFPLDDDSDNTLSNQRVFTGLPAGSYTFTETQVSGWTLTSIVCTPAGGATTNTTTGAATIALAAGDNVICTFTNVKNTPTTGSITIVKDAQPNDPQDFTFSSNQANLLPFSLDDDSDNTLSNQKIFTGLPAGSYTFTETQVSGWALTGIVCTPSGGTSVNAMTGAVTIVLAAGDNVTCTFTNTKLGTGTLTIVKDAQPDDAQDFHFVSVGAGLSDFDLDDDPTNGTLLNSKTFTNLAAGINFTVTETAVAGWTTPSIQCIVAVPGTTTTFTDQLNRTFTVNLQAGANVTCTITNVKTP